MPYESDAMKQRRKRREYLAQALVGSEWDAVQLVADLAAHYDWDLRLTAMGSVRYHRRKPRPNEQGGFQKTTLKDLPTRN